MPEQLEAFAPRPRVMGTAKILGEVVRFDVERVHGLKALGFDEQGRVPVDFGDGGSVGLMLGPDRWQAWCEANVVRILPAIPRAQRKRLQACLELGGGASRA